MSDSLTVIQFGTPPIAPSVALLLCGDFYREQRLRSYRSHSCAACLSIHCMHQRKMANNVCRNLLLLALLLAIRATEGSRPSSRQSSHGAGAGSTQQAPRPNAGPATRMVAVVGGATTYSPGYIYTSKDSGNTWQQRGSLANWVTVASSANGQKLVAVKENFGNLDPGGAPAGGIYLSNDAGATWNRIDYHDPSFHHISTSDDGLVFASIASPPQNRDKNIWMSRTRGDGWNPVGTGRNWRMGSLSSDGKKLTAAEYGGYLYTSNNFGVTLTPLTSAGQQSWTAVTSNKDGQKLAAAVDGGYIWTSTDGGRNWVERHSPGKQAWTYLATSAEGDKLAAVAKDSRIYISADGGQTWNAKGPKANADWTGIAATDDFEQIIASARRGHLWVSTDFGVTFKPRAEKRNWAAVAVEA